MKSEHRKVELEQIVTLERVRLDEAHAYRRKPPGGGSYFRVVFDGQCAGCELHGGIPERHREYERRAFSGVREARKWVEDQNADIRHERLAVASDYTTGEWLAAWLESRRGLADRTRKGYEHIITNHLTPGLGAIPLDRLSGEHIARYYSEAERTLSGQTVLHHHQCLRAALNAAVRKKLRTTNPALEIEDAPRAAPPARSWLNDEQIASLLRSLEGEGWLEPAGALAALCGLREGEICALVWGDLELTDEGGAVRVERAMQEIGGVVKIKAPKSDKGRRSVPLTVEASARLRAWRAAQAEQDLARTAPSARVVIHADGSEVTPNQIASKWRSWRKRKSNRASFGTVRFHDLRHSAASSWLRAGIPLFVVSRLLGHASIQLTSDTYGHLDTTTFSLDAVNAAQAAAFGRATQVVEIRREAEGVA